MGFQDPRVDAPPDQRHYNVPGGGVEPGETLTEALRREMLEETGARVEVGRLLLVAEWKPASGQGLTFDPPLEFLFECRSLPGEEPRLQWFPGSMEVELLWVPFDEVPRLRLFCIFGDRLIPAVAGTGTADPYQLYSGEAAPERQPDV